jgi:hypothetical protein
MSDDVLIGALLSIPIGIITGLAVTPIQRWMDGWGKDKKQIEDERTKKEYDSALYYARHPSLLSQYLLQVTIRTTFVGAGVGVLSGVIFALGNAITVLHAYWGATMDIFNRPTCHYREFRLNRSALHRH